MIKVRLSLTVNALQSPFPWLGRLILGALFGSARAGLLGVGGIARVLLYPKLDKYEGVCKSSASPDENTTL